MARVVLFHHALGLTDGIRAFAKQLRSAGHEVTTPDLLGGAIFDSVEEGVAHVERLGFATVIARGEAAVDDLPAELVYAGVSLGALPAQKLAQQRPGAQALLLYESGVALDSFGGGWPQGVALQIHAKRDDPWAEPAVLQELAREVPGAQLHLYDGADHLFTDSSLDAYDAAATQAVIERTLALLATLP